MSLEHEIIQPSELIGEHGQVLIILVTSEVATLFVYTYHEVFSSEVRLKSGCFCKVSHFLNKLKSTPMWYSGIIQRKLHQHGWVLLVTQILIRWVWTLEFIDLLISDRITVFLMISSCQWQCIIQECRNYINKRHIQNDCSEEFWCHVEASLSY